MSADLRIDPLSGHEVIIAPARSQRPHAMEPQPEQQERPQRVDSCPLCPGNEHQTPAPTLTLTGPTNGEPWAVRVVPNLYPLVTAATGNLGRGESSDAREVSGFHEVIVETPAHNQELPDRELSQVLLLLEAFQRRLTELEARPGIRHVAIFKNRGLNAGTSLEHPHSQIVALDFLPQEVRRRIQIARRYLRQNGECLLCAIVAKERRAEVRLVFQHDGFAAFAPYASQSAGEALLVPLGHAASFASTSSEARARLGRCLIVLLRQMRAAFGDPAYNLVLHTAPKRWHNDAALHWYWQLSPRLTRTGGFELGTGLSVNPMSPEDAASQLRTASESAQPLS